MNPSDNRQIKSTNTISNITFLVVEDMDNLRAQMLKDLRSIGINGTILEATSADTAIAIVRKHKIDFFISDWNLIDSTGIDFLKRLRAINFYAKTPFIMCTTKNEVSSVLEAVQNGANDYIVKPWSVDELKKKVYMTWETFQKNNKNRPA